MSELEDIAEKLIQVIDTRLKAKIPIEHALWSTKEIGEYLQRPAQVVRDRVVCVPGFPKAIRLPNAGGLGTAHPRWKASEVIAWAESFQDGKKGRPRKND